MSVTRLGAFGIILAAVVFVSCAREPSDIAEQSVEVAPVSARWDEAERGPRWTEAALVALDTHGAPLVKLVPADIDRYCPDYADASERERKAFWVNLLASLSYHESTWRPDASGGDDQWHGLLQISPATAEGYGCAAQSAEELKNGRRNVACALRIMAVTVPRDGVISRDMRGVAADWGPFHQERKRTDIQNYTRELPYCRRS